MIQDVPKLDLQGRFRLYWDFDTLSMVLSVSIIIEGKEHRAKIPLYETENKNVRIYVPTSGDNR